MKCQVCKTNEAEQNSIVCSRRCEKIRIAIIEMADKYTPTHGCENCLGDLGGNCTNECQEEFKKADEFIGKMDDFVRTFGI